MSARSKLFQAACQLDTAVLDPIQLLLYKLKLRYETVLSGTSSTLEEPVHTFAAVTPVV
jgi:hypothetical protein